MKNTFTRVLKVLGVSLLSVIVFVAMSPIPVFAAVATQTWTTRTTPEDNGWSGIAFAPSIPLFVAVATSGTHEVMTSPDGITWTVANQAASSTWISVAWSSSLSLFVAVAATGANPVMTSPDGINWTQRTAPTNNWRGVTWVPQTGLFVAVSGAGTSSDVMTSPDGINWTSRTTPLAGFFSVAYSPSLSLYVATGWAGSPSNVMTSPDAITWTSGTTSTNGTNWGGITWSPELALFVAVGNSGSNRAMYSSDGVTWTQVAVPEDTNNWNSVAWSPELGIFTAVASTGTHRVMTSPDGITWTARNNSVADTFNSVIWVASLGRFVVPGSSGVAGQRIMTSDLTAPVLSSISSGTPGATSATITWTSDISSSSQVNYGLTAGYGSSTVLDSTLTKSHSVVVSGLTCGTLYHYQVSSTYVGQNTLSSDGTFTTGSCAVAPTVATTSATADTSTTATFIGNITATGGATVTARGFNYGPTASYGSTVSESGSFSTGSFSLPVTGLSCSTGYHVRAFATNTAGTSTGSDTVVSTLPCSTSTGVTSGGHAIYIVPTTSSHVVETTTTPSVALFSKTLKLGMTDPDVLKLQQFLNAHGFTVSATGAGRAGYESAYYGAKTALAVSAFQMAHASTVLTPAGLTKGTGYFGVSTMAAANAVLQGK